MKEDILEQIVDDWFLSQPGVFTKHNVKFKPDPKHREYDKKEDSNASDIDVIAVNLAAKSKGRVSVVTCKSWQGGFDASSLADSLVKNPDKQMGGREVWKAFRELVKPKWTKAFVEAIKAETGSADFTYYIACAKVNGNREDFEKNKELLKRLERQGAKKPLIKIVTFEEMFRDYFNRSDSRTLESTQVGRLLQMIKASNIKLK